MSLKKKTKTSFRYDSLDSNSGLRLLQLLPAKTLHADIHCKLARESMDARPRYEALSYCWGKGQGVHRITVNGRPFSVGKSLFEALRHLRLESSARVLWIDAICIDQGNEEEKSLQVARMHEIYRHARRVVIWFGESAPDYDTAIDFLPFLTRVAEADDGPLWLSLLSRDEFLRRLWAVTSFFMTPDWWSRTWVVQEVALARKAVVLCGKSQVSWAVLHRFIVAWRETKASPQERLYSHLQKSALRILGGHIAGSPIAMVRCREAALDRAIPATYAALLHVLRAHDSLAVSDPRDRVYGMLGLLDGCGSGLVEVDYRKTPEELYAEVFRGALQEDNGLDAFRWILGGSTNLSKTYHEYNFQGLEAEVPRLKLPSWVPDFDRRVASTRASPISAMPPRNVSRSYVEPFEEPWRSYCASGPTRSRSRAKIAFEDDGRTLVLLGYHVDRVSALGETCPEGDEICLGGKSLRPILRQWATLAFRSGPQCPSAARSRDGRWATAYAKSLTILNSQATLPPLSAKDFFTSRQVSLPECEMLGGPAATRFSGSTGLAQTAFWRTVMTDRKIAPLHYPDDAGWTTPERLTDEDECVPPLDKHEQDRLIDAIESRGGCIYSRKFCITERGTFGLVPETTQEGDRICVLLGGEVPYILRSDKGRSGEYFKIIGESYIHGIMDGEVVDGETRRLYDLKELRLV